MATAENASSKYDKSFFGHPGGLSTLFFTEMWERFSVITECALCSFCIWSRRLTKAV